MNKFSLINTHVHFWLVIILLLPLKSNSQNSVLPRWQQTGSLPTFNNLIFLQIYNGNTLVALARNGFGTPPQLVYSTDFGKTWNKKDLPTIDDWSWVKLFNNGDRLILIPCRICQPIQYQLTNLDGNWIKYDDQIKGSQGIIQYLDYNTRYTHSGYHRTIYELKNNTWQQIYSGNAADQWSAPEILVGMKDVEFGSLENGAFQAIKNNIQGGKGFFTAKQGAPIYAVQNVMVQSHKGYYNTRNKFLISKNMGIDWDIVFQSPADIDKNDLALEQLFRVCENGRLYGDFTVGRVDARGVIYEAPVLCTSNDEGKNWTSLGSPGNNHTSQLLFLPDGTLVAVTADKGIYKSTVAYGCSSQSDPVKPETQFGTTIITHGFQPPLSSAPVDKNQWAYEMAKAILGKTQNGVIYRYKKDTGVYEYIDGIGDIKKGEKILLFDWARESSNFGQGYSEAAGDALFASLLMGYKKGQFDLDSIHFIGHSRGTVVNALSAERLLVLKRTYPDYLNKIYIDQITNIDPHDWGLGNKIISDMDDAHPEIKIDFPDKIKSYNGTISWLGVFSDTYYQFGYSDCNLDGRPVKGSKNIIWNLDEKGDRLTHTDPIYSFCGTSGIYNAYTRTIKDDNLVINGGGYNFSRIGGKKERPKTVVGEQNPTFSFFENMKAPNRVIGIMNGSFDRVLSSEYAPGWSAGAIYKPGDLAPNIEMLTFSPSGAKFQISKEFSKVTLGHDRFYIPKDAVSIRFLVKATNLKNGVLIVTLKDCLLNKYFPQTITIPSDIPDFKEYSIGLTEIQDKVVTLTFEFKSDAVDNNHLPELIIDEVKLSKQPAAPIQASAVKNTNEDNKQLANNKIGTNPSPNKINQDNIQKDLATIEYDQLAFRTFQCDEYSKLKSTPYNENNGQNFATEVVFSNYSNETVKTYFIDFEGNSLQYSSMPPNTTITQPTYINHIWFLTDKDEKCILVFSPKTRAKHEIKIMFPKSAMDLQWQPLSMPNSGKKIFCDNGRAWMVGMNDRVYFQSGNEWKEYPGGGTAQDITVFNNVPYVIGSDGLIYKGTGSGWTQFGGNGSGKSIFCDKGTIWVVGNNDAIYSFKGGSWSQYPGNGRARDIAVNNGVPYVIGIDNAIYAGIGNGWKKVSGKEGKRIFYEKEKIWIIGLDDNIYFHDGKSWILYPGDGKGIDISVYNGVPYVVGKDNTIYKGK